jgi:hypothetical protein
MVFEAARDSMKAHSTQYGGAGRPPVRVNAREQQLHVSFCDESSAFRVFDACVGAHA